MTNYFKSLTKGGQSTSLASPNYSTTFATFESEMDSSKDIFSESDESDNDFDQYSFSNPIINKASTDSLIRTNIQNKKLKKSKKSKSNHSITASSFQNFRIRSLTIISMDSDTIISMDNDTDMTGRISFGLDILGIFEEKEEFINKSVETPVATNDNMINMMMNDVQSLRINKIDQTELIQSISDIDSTNIDNSTVGSMDYLIMSPTAKVYNDDIIKQLMKFGYNKFDIMKAMECVVNANNINEIKEKLDEYNNDNQTEIKRDSKIEKRAKKRKFIEQEIIETERSYYNNLKTLLNDLIEPIFTNGYVDKKYYNQIRSSLPTICEFHKVFLNKLTEIETENNKTLAHVFNEYIKNNKDKFMDMYLEFIKDYDKILDLFGLTFHNNVELNIFLKNKRKERKPLSGFLILPIQRVPRYILLLNDLFNNTEQTNNLYKDIYNAVEMMRDITKTINERKRQIENLSQSLQIQEELNGLNEPIVKDNRHFIEQFIFIKKEIRHQRLFFLFNDILIIANQQWKVKHILNVITLEIKILNNNNINNGKNNKKHLTEFELISGKGSAVYIGENEKIVNKLKKLIGKERINMMSRDITERCNTLGSLKDVFARQSVLYEQD